MIVSVLVALSASIVLCGVYLRLALHWKIMATPNPRSSHKTPTPHGGGAPMMLAFALGVLVAGPIYAPWATPYVALALVAMGLALLGIVDDIRALSARLRFALYGLACVATAAYLLPLGGGFLANGLLLAVVGLAMLWMVNLYNFMDGIDGIAAIQCVLACAGAAFLSWQKGGQDYALFCLLLGASQLGFLVWNWPPARLFMGDAGSIPTGFLLAGLALVGVVHDHLVPASWLILLAVFITDASWTLLWRMLSGQAFTQAHRLHAYQRLARRWDSHLRVDILVVIIFSGWLLPLAWIAKIYPDYGFLLVILAYLPLVSGMAKTRPLA